MLFSGKALEAGVATVAAVFLSLGAGGANAALPRPRGVSKVALRSPQGVLVDAEGNILVASPGNDSIVLFENRPGRPLEEGDWVSSIVPFGVIESPKGPTLESPRDVAVDSKGQILVADTGNDSLKIYPAPYDSSARPQTIGGRFRRAFSAPEGVAVDEQDNIIVFDTGNARVRILSPRGRELAVIGAAVPSLGNTPQPLLVAPIGGCSLGKGYLAVADRGMPTYSLWKYDPASPSSETCRFVGYGPPGEDAFGVSVRDIAYLARNRERGTLAYIASNFPLMSTSFLYVQEVDPDDPGKLVESDAAPSLRVPLVGRLTNPAGMAFSPQGDLYLTDAASDSLQRINQQSFGDLNTPVRVDARSDRATLTYSSPALMPTFLQYGILPGNVAGSSSPELPGTSTDPARLLTHTVFLTDLLPATRYAYRYLLSEDFFCRRVSESPVRNLSQTMYFATQPRARTVEYLDFPLTVLLFTNILEGSADASIADPGPLPGRQIEDRVRSELDRARLFFWVNSRMTCNVRPELIVVSDRLPAGLLPSHAEGVREQEPLSEFLSRLEERVSKHTGRDLSTTPNLLLIFAVRSYDPAEGRYVMRTSPSMTCGLPRLGGAVTIMAYAGERGVSDDPADNTWSFITEYRRQLSIMHLASGTQDTLPRLLENLNSDLSLVTWDSLADPLRAVGRRVWLSNRYGLYKVTRDEDEDGVPDDEPDCPLDEKRFGTTPRQKDTDGDGVSDLKEILASRWAATFPITKRLPDGTWEKVRAMANLAAPLPSAVDTDADGIGDLKDRNPLCPLGDSIPRRSIIVDGKIGGDEWEGTPSLRVLDAEYSGTLRVAWSENRLCLCLVGGDSDVPPSIRMRIDGAADGLLRGSDNLVLVLHPRENESFDVWTGMAHSPAKGFDLSGVVAVWRKVEGESQAGVEIGLEASASLGLNLFAGKELAFDFELRSAKSACWLRVFEPLMLFRGTLVETTEESGASQ
jgi:hypothetical protein